MTQESGFATPDEMRNKALQRLAVAAVVTTGALAALWWLDQSGAPRQPVRKMAVKPAPITSAPEISPPGVTEPAPAPLEETGKAEAPPAAAVRPEAPPPPKVNNAPVAPATRPENAAPSVPATPPAAPPAPAPHAAAGGAGFVIQVGLFSNPKNAQELVQKLGRMGIKAHTETRVQLGPFQTKAEADKAQAELRKRGVTGVVAGVMSGSAPSR
ncbi:MAG: SPOR domain-containing protein [Betaproteobacteria bacterium]|nr:SPOR domain-containing protein [Betaproteobacteria bacterium]